MAMNFCVLFLILYFDGIANSMPADEKTLPCPVLQNNYLQNKKSPIIIAHRGASGMYPEHTKLAYRYELEDFVFHTPNFN